MNSNIFNLFQRVHSGLYNSTQFQQNVKSHYMQHITLNTFENLEKIHTGASINTIDIDSIENR